ncbi:MAG: hypothetical protein HY741_14950 [Chloroflexi bacterium]|nr:hypothetical protein [Chloroflexota bacterium]
MNPNWIRRAFLPSLEIILFLLLFWLSLWLMPDMLNSDGDLGRHLTVGNYILDTRTILVQDVFSHTRYGERLVLHEWLSEVVYALAYRAAGLNGVAWLTALLLASIYSVLAVGLRALGVSAPLAFLAALAAYFTGIIHHLPRPHLFSLLCLTLLLLACEVYRHQESMHAGITPRFTFHVSRLTFDVSRFTFDVSRFLPLILFLPVMLLWANFNGAFVLAFLTLGMYCVGAVLERETRRALVFFAFLVLAFLVSLVNPYGIGLPQHVFGFMGNRFLVDNTVEYLAPNFHAANTWLFAAWILFSIILFGRNTTRVAWTSLIVLSVWTAFGLYSARNITNYAMVVALVTVPVAEVWLTTRVPSLRVRFDNLNALVPIAGGWVWGVIVVALLMGLQASGAKFDVRGAGNVFTAPTFPVNAVDFLQQHLPQGKMFNEYTWGGYLEYRLFPQQRVFIDGDNDFFGEALVREYLDVINARGSWETILEKYDVRWVIVPPQRALTEELARLGNWREVYRDESAVVFTRK